ncbi:hypothetical protein [Tautonia rosea]|uniref:hypothetical protein n=1 Tax=Tautonia rosea TaxID=2728037 RepID=UPI001473479F|nr:hypothetical protein [Tautonia rosea]
MSRWFRMAFGLSMLLIMAGRAEAQGWRTAAPTPQPQGYVVGSSTLPVVTSPSTLASGYGRRVASGGLIETAARRINPFAAPSRAGNVAFAPQVYRQPPMVPSTQVRRPLFGSRTPGYRIVEPSTPLGVPTTGTIPSVNCPTCPK